MSNFNKYQEEMIQDSGFFAIPITVMKSKLSPIEKLLIASILSLMPKGYCYASNAKLAEYCGCNKDVVSRKIQEWKAKDWLQTQVTINEETKQVKERKIFLNVSKVLEDIYIQNLSTPTDLKLGGIDSKSVGGIDLKSVGTDSESRVIDNIINNNIINNILPKKIISKSLEIMEAEDNIINELIEDSQNPIDSNEILNDLTKDIPLPSPTKNKSEKQQNKAILEVDDIQELFKFKNIECEFFKISKKQKESLKNAMAKRGYGQTEIILKAIQEVEDWMARSESGAGFKARKSKEHWRHCYASWVIERLAKPIQGNNSFKTQEKPRPQLRPVSEVMPEPKFVSDEDKLENQRKLKQLIGSLSKNKGI